MKKSHFFKTNEKLKIANPIYTISVIKSQTKNHTESKFLSQQNLNTNKLKP